MTEDQQIHDLEEILNILDKNITLYRFAEQSDTVLNAITAIDALGHLDDLFAQALTAETFEDIDFSKNGK